MSKKEQDASSTNKSRRKRKAVSAGIYTAKEREQLAKQYVPLVKKLVGQYTVQCPMDPEEIEGFAWQGFTEALNDYNPERSKMSFKSYAAYAVRNCILNGINTCGSTIKVSRYSVEKYSRDSVIIPKTINFSKLCFDPHFLKSRNDDTQAFMGEEDPALEKMGVEDASSPDNPWNILHASLTDQFGQEWTKSFCETYGVCGYECKMGKEIAAEIGLTPAAITRRNNKMIAYIKSTPELVSQLADLVA